MQRMTGAALVDPEIGLPGGPLYGDGEVILVTSWRARVGNAGAVFCFHAEGARQTSRVENYGGTVRHTSAVVSIERVSDAGDVRTMR